MVTGLPLPYKRRLKELKTWNKPLCDPDQDTYGHWDEWRAKIKALENLIKNAVRK